MKRASIFVLLLLVCLMGLSTATPLQAAERGEDDREPPLVVRVYDVTDLIFRVRSYPARRLSDLGDRRKLFPETAETSGPYGGSMTLNDSLGIRNGMIWSGGGISGDNARHRRVEPIIGLSTLIQSVVSPNDWVDVGGNSSAVTYGNLLVIHTTENNQKQVNSLLNAIRQKMAARKMVSVETHWLWLTKEQLAALVAADSKESQGQVAPCAIEEAAWKRLLLAQAKGKENCDIREGYHATIKCMNGQRVSAVAGRQRSFMMSVIPVVGQFADKGVTGQFAGSGLPRTSSSYERSTAMGYEPVVTIVQEGAAIEVRPIICGDDQVLLDLHARVVKVESTEKEAKPAATPETAKPTEKPTSRQGTVIRELAEKLDKPVLMTHRLDTTIRAAAGRHTLVGGITCETTPSPGQPNLYLFVKPLIHEPPKGKAKPAIKK